VRTVLSAEGSRVLRSGVLPSRVLLSRVLLSRVPGCGVLGPGGPFGPRGIAAAFALSGVVHLVRPAVFTPLVPRFLPAPRALVLASGAAELVCAAGLVTRARWAAGASTALLLAIWPGNVVMALDAGSGRHPGPADSRLVAWARVPLQPLLIWAARR